MFTISSQAAAVNFITKMHFFNCTNHINSFNKAQSPDNKYPMQSYMGSYVSTNNKIHSSSDCEIDPKNLSCQLQCTVIQECLVSYKHAKVNLLFQQTFCLSESFSFCICSNCWGNLILEVIPVQHVDSTRRSKACWKFTSFFIPTFTMKFPALNNSLKSCQSVGKSVLVNFQHSSVIQTFLLLNFFPKLVSKYSIKKTWREKRMKKDTKVGIKTRSATAVDSRQ